MKREQHIGTTPCIRHHGTTNPTFGQDWRDWIAVAMPSANNNYTLRHCRILDRTAIALNVATSASSLGYRSAIALNVATSASSLGYRSTIALNMATSASSLGYRSAIALNIATSASSLGCHESRSIDCIRHQLRQ